MYTSNYSTTLRNDPSDHDQRQGNLYVKRNDRDQDQYGQSSKKCPSCGSDLVLLLEKFGEISEPKGPGPPTYPQGSQANYSQDQYYNQPGHPQDSHHYYKQPTQHSQGNNYYYSQSGYQQSSPSNYYNHQDTYGSYSNPNVISQTKYSQPGNFSTSHDNYYNQSEGYYPQSHDPWHKSHDYNQGYCNNTQQQDILSGGWYCSYCGLHILPNDRIMDVNMTEQQEEPPPMETEAMSPDGMDSNKSIDEEYKMWEIQVNKDFSSFLTHIKDYFSEKETKLKEYQIDLCQREKSLKSNECYFQDRMDTLKKAEEEFQDKVERLNLQVQDRMQRLREYEARITRMNKSQKDKYKEVSTQTVTIGSYKDIYHQRGYHQPTRNFGHNSNNNQPPNARSVAPQDSRLSNDPRMHEYTGNVAVRRSYENPPPKQNGIIEKENGVSDSDYMFMGDVTKGSPKDKAGSPYYVDIQQVGHSPKGKVNQHPQEMYVDTSNSNNAGDSGFNTPDADFDLTNQYSYEMEGPPSKSVHVSRPRNIKVGKVNSSNNSNNIPLESQSMNSSSSRNSNSSLNYNGERAVLVKSPNGVESYTTRAQKFRNMAVHRSSSLPQNRAADRSPSADRDRTQSMPPDPETVNGLNMETALPERPKSAYFLDEPSPYADAQVSPDSQRPRAGSFGSNVDQNRTSRIVTSNAPKPMTPTKSRLPRDRKPKHPDNSTDKDTSTDSKESNGQNPETGKIGLRSRSSESVQRGYRYQKQLKYNEAKKKAQSELNLSSEKWAEDNNNDGVVIYHRKSTSFDTPQSYGYTHHTYQSETVRSTTKPIVTETRKVEISRSDGFVQNTINNKEAAFSYSKQKQLPTSQTVVDKKTEIATEKPRVRGRRSDMSMPHRKLNKVSYYTASGSHLNSQPSSYGITIQAIPKESPDENRIESPSYPIDPSSGVNMFKSNTEPNNGTTKQYPVKTKSTSIPNRYQNDGVVSNMAAHETTVPKSCTNQGYHNNFKANSDEKTVHHSQVYKDPKNGLFVDVSNEGNSESPEMTSTPRDYVPQSGSQDPVYPNTTNQYNVGSNTNHSTNIAQHVPSNTQYRDNTKSGYPHRYVQNNPVAMVNGKVQLSDQSTWAIKKRRELPKMPAHDSNNNNYGQKQLRYAHNDHPSPKLADHEYVNMQQTNRTTLNNSDTAINQRSSKLDNRETKLRRRTDHYVQRSNGLGHRLERTNGHIDPRSDQRNNHFDKRTDHRYVQNNEPFDQRYQYDERIDPRYSQLDQRTEQRNEFLDQRTDQRNDHLDQRYDQYDHRNPQSDSQRSGKTISYIPSDNVISEPKTHSPHHEESTKAEPVAENVLDDVFVTDDNNISAPQGKKKYFGFSPRYKEILFKYGSNNKNSEKTSSKKKDKDQPSPIIINSGTTRFGFKKSGEKESKGKKEKDKDKHDKDKTRPTSPRSKLPHYNTYIKEVTTK